MVPEDLAAKFRDDHGYMGRGGVVVVFDGEACGWVNCLRNPEHWRHGAVAVDEDGNKWKAVGRLDTVVGVPGADDTATSWVRLPDEPRRRGRPATGQALSAAERQARYRAKKAEAGKAMLTVEVSQDVLDALQAYVQFRDGVTQGEAVDRILRAYLLRKR